jgi:hypothetical protein
LQWRHYEYRVSAKTQAQDLLYAFHAVSRLNDAQLTHPSLGADNYIIPGILWWAFDPVSARQGHPNAVDPDFNRGSDNAGAVVLLDGIDRVAPSDMPEWFHTILTRSFHVHESGLTVTAGREDILIVATADSARVIPHDIRRRVVSYQMPLPSFDDFVRIGRLHFPHLAPGFIENVVNSLLSSPSMSRQATLVEMHEFLDILAAVERLEIVPGGTNWRILLDALNIDV